MTWRSAIPLYAILLFALIFIISDVNNDTMHRFPTITKGDQTGFRTVDCWFSTNYDWPPVECYQMQVAENRSAENPRMISFPMIVFRSQSRGKNLSPVLHLGAGGPGAPMYFDDTRTIDYFWRTNDSMSLAQGRDLIVIDPRGAGLSNPLLTCDLFVDSELTRFQQNLSLLEEMESVNNDYISCIQSFIAKGIDFSSYNSLAVAHDVEEMRQAAGIQRWVLIGVSYGASYAQAIASQFPDSVESMVLDSAAMPIISRHENYLELVMGPFLKLFQYCNYDPKCQQPIKNVEERIWRLYENLNAQPITIQFEHTSDTDKVPIALNGKRFISAILQGIYGVKIFKDLPYIITELEVGKYNSLQPYLWQFVDFMLDRTYGDVSAIAHYCFEEKPFIDFKRIKSQIDLLPSGYIQDTERFMFNWTDYCDDMQLEKTATANIPANSIATPTLFLQGRLDTVTPLSSIISGQQYFLNSQLVTLDLSHSILTSSECAIEKASQFIENPLSDKKQTGCD